MNIVDLEPRIVWRFFHEVTQVPRPSRKEEKIIAFLENFAGKFHLEYKKDAVGNILMLKPATAGCEAYPTIILQSHVDMVCEKNAGKSFDFENDPIETIIDGEWLKANGTTLGADNGIGVAAQLAVLASDDIVHGPLECLFTVDEETGLTGAQALQSGFLQGKILLNLDSEDEGEIFIGCAGGMSTKIRFDYKAEQTDTSRNFFRISVKGLKGGHSGGDIHLGLGNANKILARFILQTMNKMDTALASFNGGNLHNAIPREASAVIGTLSDKKEDVRVVLNHFIAQIEQELKNTDKGVSIEMESVPAPSSCIDRSAATRLIHALNACPHGVISMSSDIDGLVETSTNLASVKTDQGAITIVTSQRSSVESRKEDIAGQIRSLFTLAGAVVEQSEGYPGWTPNTNSPILRAAIASYLKLFGKEPKIKAIHAGLECGLFLEKYPWLDMISFGPTLRNVHSPDEKILIPTVALWWQHLLGLLKECNNM
ncbi:MAG: aminoacyl-histidine dipeptidase [Tannerellaceae bacterium]|jgi:dipeptidase D|nr:aminoacyl-histidine dipeptidase [Tannerellaceae bacterium]